MNPGDIVVLLLLLSPLIAGSFIVFAKKESGVALVNRFNTWVAVRHSQVAKGSRFWSKYVVRTTLLVLKKLAQWTEKIQDPFWRAGVRVVAWGYTSIALAFVAIAIAYMAIVIAVAIAIIAFVFYVLSQMGSQTSTDADSKAGTREYFSREGTSRERESFFGDKYIERRDPEGNIVGRSRRRESLFGDKYVEYEDAEGNIVGRSRQKESLFGDKYTEHQDAEGNIVGESRSRETLFGDKYTEHQDSEGDVIGESRQRETLLGDKYTEHKSRKS